MIAIALFFVRMLSDCFKSRWRLEAEIVVLRHHLNVLRLRATSTVFALVRSGSIRLALSPLSSHPGRHNHRQARDGRALAPNGVLRLPAMEVPSARWPTVGR
jgi:hypothetical protein